MSIAPHLQTCHCIVLDGARRCSVLASQIRQFDKWGRVPSHVAAKKYVW